MGGTEERLRLLKMIQSGQITAEEGSRLMAALDRSRAGESSPDRPVGQPQQVRILVTDLGTGKQKLDVNMPWRLIGVGSRMGARVSFAGADIPLNEIMEAIHSGARGKVVDVFDEQENERVEVFVE